MLARTVCVRVVAVLLVAAVLSVPHERVTPEAAAADRDVEASGRVGPLRADHHHRQRVLQGQRKEVSRFFEGRCAVPDHDAGEVLLLRRQPVAEQQQLAPFREGDLGGGQVGEAHRQDLRDLPRFRETVQELRGVQHLARRNVVVEVERPAAHRSDGAAGADEGDARLHAAAASGMAKGCIVAASCWRRASLCTARSLRHPAASPPPEGRCPRISRKVGQWAATPAKSSWTR